MRINAHAHVFNLRSVFTRETLRILLDRLGREGMPAAMLDGLREELGRYLEGLIDADDILSRLAGRGWPDCLAFLRIALLPSIERVAGEVMKGMGRDRGLVALMMDITDGSDGDDRIRKQMSDTSGLVLEYPGRIFPFFMVNPLRPTHFGLMRHAVEDLGFWGVKLYPSLGYPVGSPEMENVFAYCERNSIPLLTHCTSEGFRKSSRTAALADPARWRGVLRRFPGLKVCFGHFGGCGSLIRPWIDPDGWTGTIMGLMEDHAGVYADIAFHDGPMDGDEEGGVPPEEARKNYGANVAYLLKTPPFRDRVLFGTDYWMVRMRIDDRGYWAFYRKLFSRTLFRRMSETNPACYLGLPGTPAPAQWLTRRHLDFFASRGMRVGRDPAGWLADAARSLRGAGFAVTGGGRP